MNKDYILEKENPYRFGVYQGNYVEEMYSKDLSQIPHWESPLMTTEFQDQFKVQEITVQKNDSNSKKNNKKNEQMDQKMLLKLAAQKTNHISMNDDKLIKINTQYSSTYQLNYDSKIKPQEFIKNNLKGEKVIREGLEKTQEQIKELKNSLVPNALKNQVNQNHYWKDQGFVSHFNKPHEKIGLRK